MHRISDEDAERLLGRRVARAADGAELADVAAFLDALRAAVPAATPPGVEAALIQRLGDAALEAGHRPATAPTRPLPIASASRTWRPRVALAAKVAVAVALLPAAMAGLAFAGVTLPEPAREAMERIGLDLPNQSAVDDDESVAGGDESDGRNDAAKRSSGNGGSNAGGRDAAGGSDKSSSTSQKHGRRGQNPSADGDPGHDSSGQGSPQLGEPAPITPPGQGGTPPGQGGPSPSQPAPQSAQPQSVGPPGGTPPGQAKK